MKNFYFIMILCAAMLISSCATMNKSQKGAVIGTAGGGAIGAVIGKASGNTGLGAIIGVVVGGATGAIIGHQMDKQAKDIEKAVPDAKVIRVGEGIVVEFSSNVLFGYNKSSISNNAMISLDKLVTILNSYPDTNIEIQGHTDSRGTNSYNMTLSRERAYAVSSYLTSKNILSNRLSVVGYGESLPKYQNNTENGRSQNRRVEFLISANEKMREDAEKSTSN